MHFDARRSLRLQVCDQRFRHCTKELFLLLHYYGDLLMLLCLHAAIQSRVHIMKLLPEPVDEREQVIRALESPLAPF
jgi:hypothetical protein